MPLRNFHSARVKNPPKGKATSAVVQAYRFDKKTYTATQARAWLKRNKVSFIKFEKAGGTTNTKTEAISLSELADTLRAKLEEAV